MHEHPNSLLKVGCLLFIVGGLASALVTLAGLLLSVGSMMDSELYPYVDQMPGTERRPDRRRRDNGCFLRICFCNGRDCRNHADH